MGTLVCTLVVSKTDGVTLTVENGDESITQTLKADGTTVTLEVTGPDGTSTMTMDSGNLTIDCSEAFKLTAKTIECSSSDKSTYKSGATMAVTSSQKMALTSEQANIEQSASAGDIKASAQNVTLSGTTKVSASAPDVSASATNQAEIKGMQVSINGTGSLSAESSGNATFKGSITNVQGSIVNVG